MNLELLQFLEFIDRGGDSARLFEKAVAGETRDEMEEGERVLATIADKQNTLLDRVDDLTAPSFEVNNREQIESDKQRLEYFRSRQTQLQEQVEIMGKRVEEMGETKKNLSQTFTKMERVAKELPGKLDKIPMILAQRLAGGVSERK